MPLNDLANRRANNHARYFSVRVACHTLVMAVVALSVSFSGCRMLHAKEDAANAGEVNKADDKKPLANEEPTARGALVKIAIPLSNSSAIATKARISQATKRLLDPSQPQGNSRPVLLLEFVPQAPSKFGEGCEFLAAYDIAKFLTRGELAGVKKVAYLPKGLKGHGLLIAQACEEIVMAPNTELGEAGIDEEGKGNIDAVMRTAYASIARSRRTIPEAIVLGMLDPNLAVFQIRTERETLFATTNDLKSLRKDRSILSEDEIIAVGSLGLFTAENARKLGIVRYLISSRDDLAAVYHLPLSALEESANITGDRKPTLFEIEGAITPRAARHFINLFRNEKTNGTRWVCIKINSRGGDLQAALDIAADLAMQDASDVQTVAYIPQEASGAAAIIALACDRIVLGPNATLGGANEGMLNAQEIADHIFALQNDENSIAKKTGKPWSLFAAFIDPNAELYAYRNKETGQVRYLSPEEAQEKIDADDWVQQGESLLKNGKPLTLSAEEAKTMGIAWSTAADLKEVAAKFGLEEEPKLVKMNWVLELIEALSAPGFAMLLLMIGFVGLYIEIQTPGLGIGGFIAAIAFLLFFWSNSLEGNVQWLEVLLFLFGICCILLEIFVIPGFGIFGLGGGLMLLASLILFTQTFILPNSEQDMIALRRSLMIVTGACCGFLVLASIIRRYLPHTPIFNRIMLAPLSENERAEQAVREQGADFSHLLGKLGTATTPIRPTGKADIDGEIVHVMAEHGIIERGEAIQVVHVQGSHVTVTRREA